MSACFGYTGSNISRTSFVFFVTCLVYRGPHSAPRPQQCHVKLSALNVCIARRRRSVPMTYNATSSAACDMPLQQCVFNKHACDSATQVTTPTTRAASATRMSARRRTRYLTMSLHRDWLQLKWRNRGGRGMRAEEGGFRLHSIKPRSFHETHVET